MTDVSFLPRAELLAPSAFAVCWQVNICFNSGVMHVSTHTFIGPLSGTNRVSRYQKDKTRLDFTEARDSEWQWHQLGHIQVCTSLHSVFYRPMPSLPPNQQCQSTEGIITVTTVIQMKCNTGSKHAFIGLHHMKIIDTSHCCRGSGMVCVCLSICVCWAHWRALQNWIHQSRWQMPFEFSLMWAQGTT